MGTPLDNNVHLIYGISKKVESWKNNMDENEPIERDGIWERKESNDMWVREDGKFEKNRYVKNNEEKFNKLKLMGFSKNKHWMICGLVKVESSTKFFMKS